MTLAELLKEQGVADEVITKITEGMKKNKIFTSSEENLDVRYKKLKDDMDALTKKDGESQSLIAELRKETEGNKGLQDKFTDYEATVQKLKEENEALKLESSLKIALLDAGAKSTDIDYLMFKAKNSEKGVEIGEGGVIKNKDGLIEGLKTQFPSNFEGKEEEKIQENKLDKNGHHDDDQEPKTLAEALKMKYEPEQ